MPNLLCSSCSFSGHLSSLFNALLDNNTIEYLNMINAGEPGRGNKWIAYSLINQLEKNDKEISFVIANWTSIYRANLYIDKDTNNHHKNITFEEFADREHYSDFMSFRTFKWYDQGQNLDSFKNDFSDENRSGILSTTSIDPNLDSEFAIEQFVGMHDKYFHNQPEQFEETLASIVILQNYCKLNNIVLLNCTWQSIWHDLSTVEHIKKSGQVYFNKDNNKNIIVDNYNDLTLLIDKYPQFRFLYNQIDFNDWYFYDSGRCSTGGVADWCIENDIDNYFGGMNDPYHPTDVGYEKFTEQEFLPWVLNKLKEKGVI